MSESLHRRVGAAVADAGVDLLVAVEGDAKWIADAATRAGLERSQVVFFADAAAAGAALPELLAAGDVVLLKGSRGVGLEKTLDRLVEAFAPVEQGVE